MRIEVEAGAEGVKGWFLGGLNEASLLVLRRMKGLSGSGSHPAQMGIGVSYCEGFPRKYAMCVCMK
jgi:hypothetical protein